MKNYEKKLENFKCGWQKSLDAARINCPDGEVDTVEHYTLSNGIKTLCEVEQTYYYNPVKYFNILNNKYEETRLKIKAIVDRGITVEDLPELLELDCLLSCILDIYTFDDYDYRDLSEIDNPEYKHKYEDFETDHCRRGESYYNYFCDDEDGKLFT